MRTLALSDDLALPQEAVTETFALLAARRAGKTNAGRVMAEEMFHQDLPFVAVDPVGSWFGLRSSRDGHGPGLPIPIFGGRHGDVPLEQTGGTLIADLIVNENLSCILDVSQFESEGAKKRFLLDFARRLYQRNETPRHLFLEEADDYCPQQPMRDEAQLLRAWENIVRRGGMRGLGCTLITQRSASINKNLLTQVGTLIALRTTGPQDRDAVGLWLKHHAQSNEILASLSSLKNGEAWVWSPHFLNVTKRFRFRLSTTFDSGATPKVGAKRRVTTLADVDLGAVTQQMAATIERAKATDPKVLQARIAELERQIGRPNPASVVKSAAAPSITRIDGRVLRGLSRAILGAKASCDVVLAVVDQFKAALPELPVAAQAIRQALAATGLALNRPAAATVSLGKIDESRQRQPRVIHPDRGSPLRLTADPGSVGAGPMRILANVARFAAGLTREQAAMLSGFSSGGGTWRTYLPILTRAGLVEFHGDLIRATDSGVAALDAAGIDHGVVSALEDLIAIWMPKLNSGEQNMLRAVLDAEDGLTKEELGERTGFAASGGTFRTYLPRILRTALVKWDGERVRLNPHLRGGLVSV